MSEELEVAAFQLFENLRSELPGLDVRSQARREVCSASFSSGGVESSGLSRIGLRTDHEVTMRAASILGVAIVASLLTESSAIAKVAPASLADLVRQADFIGIVRVDRVGGRIPLIRPRRATATILQSWKGQREGSVTFVAQPTWSCDTSDARRGEEVVVFIEGDSLLLAGQGRMRIFERAGRRLAAIWPGVLLPPDLDTHEGPEPEYGFMRGVLVEDLGAAVAASTSAAAEQE